MIIEIVFDTINVIAAVIVFCILVYKLTALADKFTPLEMAGMGLIGAGGMMVIGPVTYKPSPYDDWAFTLMLIGQALYFVGRMTRHRYNNWKAGRDAERRLRERGRL